MKQRILLLFLLISITTKAQKFDSLRQESRALTQLILILDEQANTAKNQLKYFCEHATSLPKKFLRIKKHL